MRPGKFRIYYKPVTIALVSIIMVFSIFFLRNTGTGYDPYGLNNLFVHENVLYYAGRISDSLKTFPNLPWKSAPELQPEELKHKDELWYALDLHGDYKKHLTLLIIPNYILGIEIYLNDECIYKYGSYHTGPPRRLKRFNPQPLIIPLSNELKKNGSKPPVLYARLHYNEFPLEIPLGELYMGALDGVAQIEAYRFIRFKFWENCMGMILLFFSSISFGFFFLQWKSRDYLYFTFGLLLLSTGISYWWWWIPIVFGLTPIAMIGLHSLNAILGPVISMAFVGQLVGPSYRRMVIRLCVFLIVFLVIFTIIVRLYPSLLVIMLLAYFSQKMIYMCVCFFILFKSRSQEYAVLLLIVFSIIGFVSLINSFQILIGVVVFDIVLEQTYSGMGALVLIGTLGYIIIDKYRKSKKRAQDYALDLEIKERKMLLLKSENLQARFDVLKNQVNPHFLFNTFGALISLIQTNQSNAVHFVEELSRVYRHLLQTQDKNLVTLRSELEFMASYSYLMKRRFGRRVQISNSVAECYLDSIVPPLSLQLLIENAIKHNVISHKHPLTISIEVHSDDFLVVKNNHHKKAVLEKPTKVGLANLKQRYAMLTQRKIEVISDAMIFLVKIPLLRENEL